MLVLSRKKNESIIIDNTISIVVVEIRGDKVRLGIQAPETVSVHRREVYDAIHRYSRESRMTHTIAELIKHGTQMKSQGWMSESDKEDSSKYLWKAPDGTVFKNCVAFNVPSEEAVQHHLAKGEPCPQDCRTS